MPKCPKCGEKITYLENVRDSYTTYRIFVFDGTGYYEKIDETSGDLLEYRCPRCGQVLFYDEKGAINFLKNSGGLKESS